MFEGIHELDDDEFFMKLMSKPHKLRISNIGDLRESNNGNGNYFYIDFVLVETSQEVGIGFNVKVNDDMTLYVSKDAKLYPLLSFVSGIKDDKIRCTKKDIDDALSDLEFEAKASREKKGNKKWYVIRPISKGGE